MYFGDFLYCGEFEYDEKRTKQIMIYVIRNLRRAVDDNWVTAQKSAAAVLRS